MDGLANTWLFDADEDFVASESFDMSEDIDRNSISSSYIQKSSVPGCYATLAYDDQGRDSYSEHGVRLKYVILQKTGNEFLVSQKKSDYNKFAHENMKHKIVHIFHFFFKFTKMFICRILFYKIYCFYFRNICQGATVRLERNSILIARIVNGGLACKTSK